MVPFSYFAPIHKSRQKAKQGENSSTNEDNPRAVFDDQITNQLSESEVQYEDQYEVIGGLNSEGEPAGASLDEGPTRLGSNRIFRNLHSLRPPLLSPQPQTSGEAPVAQNVNASGIRHRHLAVLITILHRSLLQHDYDRAAKAWSIMLRSEQEGHSVDLRQGHRWGLGAEIFLRQLKQPSRPEESSSLVKEHDSDASTRTAELLSNAQVEKLKEYYYRLSLQYPFHKSFPDATGPLDFHSALFGLWIYASTINTTSEANVSSAFYKSDQEGNGFAIQEHLHHAREISDEIVELTSSPPYSDSIMFQRLKVMIDRWIADLVTAQDAIRSPSTADMTRQ